MGRRSGRRNQAKKSERRSLESNLFCEGEIKEAKDQVDGGDACQWDTYQMSLFGGIDDDQEDQSIFCTGKADDRNCIHGHPKMSDENLEQEQKTKVGLSFRFRLIGYFRKKSGSSKHKKEIKEKNYKEGKRKESRYMSSIDVLICCGCA